MLGVETAEHLEEEVVADLNEPPELPRLKLLGLTPQDPSFEAWEEPSSPMLGTEYTTSPRFVASAHWTLPITAHGAQCKVLALRWQTHGPSVCATIDWTMIEWQEY